VIDTDFAELTFAGLATIGIVNVLTFFYPEIDSRIKFAISIVAAFALSFIPEAISVVLYDKTLQAIEVAFAASGTYKLAQKIGG